MAPKLDNLLTDGRLARLFSTEARHCALQLWILQIKCGQSTENRVVYGRLLPYSHSNDSWSFSDNDDFLNFGRVKAKVTRLNLYAKSLHCADLLRQLSTGRTISAISEELELGLSDKLKAEFGATALAADKLAYRPVAYLLNRDAHDRWSPSSPHGASGAFSASITQTDKGALFRQGNDYDVALTASVVKHLNAETGLDFGGADATRFGDLELLVFPALNDLDQHLLSVSWVDAPRALIARFDPMQVPCFGGFQFHLSIANDSQIVYSAVAAAERGEEGVFQCKFELSDDLRERTDSTELEIFGFHGDHSQQSVLCCRWRIGYIRELNLQGHVVCSSANPVKFDWLEKATRPAMSERVKAALTLNRGNAGFANHIGGRKADPWVPANRELVSLFARLHPPKSEGQFFLRWSQDDGEGRLQFVEWFRSLLTKYHQHQIIFFDPYFGDAGLGLILLCAAPMTDCIVFTSLPKSVGANKPMRRKSDKVPQERVNDLIANCEHNRNLLRHFKLRIYGLKDGRLHDRYILIVGADGLPVAGFNLSNSFQKAAENYPLLITPIPADILLKVEKYKSGLVQELEAAQPKDDSENSSTRLLFDSTALVTVRQDYEPFRFLEDQHAGDVLSVWVNEPSLQGLSGAFLKERMAALNLLKDGSLTLSDTAGLQNCLLQKAGDFTDFTAIWKIIGEVLAHSHIEEYCLRQLKPEPDRGFLEFLAQFLEASFNRTDDDLGNEVAVVDARFFRMPVEELLHSSYHPHHLFHAIKYSVLTWPEYYVIKLLWWFAPGTLLSIAEVQISSVPTAPQGPDTVRLSLLSQIVSEISLSVQFEVSAEQRDRLVQSGSGLLQWMGLNAIEMQLVKPGGLAAVLQLVTAFVYPERVRALGWMVHHAARNPQKTDIYNGLVAALHDALPADIPAEELVRLVNSMRGHMLQLAWVEPWLFQDAVFPLLQNNRANYDDACVIWVQELASMLEPKLTDQPQLFERAREGQTTNITAFLFAYSSPTRQQAILKSMQDILKRQQRVVQQPLASTSNWNRWDRALTVSLWLLAFFRWGEFYLRQRSMTDYELERLSSSARGLVMVRPMSEWRSEGAGKPGELAAFLDQVDELLDTSDGPKSNLQ